jgi:hypothetical protein
MLFANGLLLMPTTVALFSTSLVTQYLEFSAAKVAARFMGGHLC